MYSEHLLPSIIKISVHCTHISCIQNRFWRNLAFDYYHHFLFNDKNLFKIAFCYWHYRVLQLYNLQTFHSMKFRMPYELPPMEKRRFNWEHPKRNIGIRIKTFCHFDIYLYCYYLEYKGWWHLDSACRPCWCWRLFPSYLEPSLMSQSLIHI